MRILLVDDESGVRRAMAATIRNFEDRYDVWEAEDGDEALRLLDDTFELIVTDIRMPGMDGIELTRQVRERYPELPIILLTGFAEFEYARAAIRQNITEYLLKPVSVQSLHESLKQIASAIRGKREQERIVSLRQMTLMEKRVQDLLYELPLPYYDERLFPDFEQISLITFVMEEASTGGRMRRFAVKNVLAEVLQAHGLPLVFVEESHVTAVLFAKEVQSPSAELITMCRQIVRSTLRINLSAADGGTSASLSDVGAMYWRSLHKLGFDHPAEPEAAESGGPMHHLIRQTLHIIDTEYDQELTLSGLAERLYLNPNYLSTLFKSETGATFTQTLVRIRMEKAKKLLRTTKLKIYEISAMTGYADSAHFSRVFKTQESISPYDYRDKFTSKES